MPYKNTMIKHSSPLKTHRGTRGFSLIEMMLAMLIGSIIMSGIFSIFSNTREAQRTLDQHLTMVSDARFAVELITYDLRHASLYGGTNLATLIECRREDSSCAATQPTNDCLATGWAHDLDLPVYSPLTDTEFTDYLCPLVSHLAGTDVITIRYAETTPVATADLAAESNATNVTYIRSNFKSGIVFVGTTQPSYSGDTNDSFTQNYQLIARTYYISSYSDTVGDGMPALRRLDLQATTDGPAVVDQLLMPGVENLQIQFGVDINGDGDINKYVNAANVSAQSVTDGDATIRKQAKQAWVAMKAIKMWILVRAAEKEKNFTTTSSTNDGYELGGFKILNATLDDGYRRLLLSNVVRMRNMEYSAVQ